VVRAFEQLLKRKQRGATAYVGIVLGLCACGGPEFKSSKGSGGATSNASGGTGAAGESSATGGKAIALGGTPSSTAGGSSGRNAAGETSAGASTMNGGVSTATGGVSTATGGVSTATGGSLGGGGIGLGVGGLLSGAGGSGRAFPVSAVLDDFDREDGGLGSNWAGPTEHFTIEGQTLHDLTSDGAPVVWTTKFGAAQEVFAKLTQFVESAAEINLVLRAQDGFNGCDFMEVLYKPNRKEVGVDYCADNEWHTAGSTAASFAAGDEFGARITAEGKVSVFINRQLVTTFDASGYPHRDGGHIGVSAFEGGVAAWDDFGGGDVR
jgi:hypothetical protein